MYVHMYIYIYIYIYTHVFILSLQPPALRARKPTASATDSRIHREPSKQINTLYIYICIYIYIYTYIDSHDSSCRGLAPGRLVRIAQPRGRARAPTGPTITIIISSIICFIIIIIIIMIMIMISSRRCGQSKCGQSKRQAVWRKSAFLNTQLCVYVCVTVVKYGASYHFAAPTLALPISLPKQERIPGAGGGSA